MATATAIALLVLASWLVPPPPSAVEVAAVNDQLLTAVYDPPTRPVEIRLARGDGQIFVTHAMDPLIRRPDLVRSGKAEQAYRLQRPLYGWAGWLASGGRADLAPWALIALTVGSVAFLAGVVAVALRDRGRDPRWAVLVALLPGVTTDLTSVGPEALGAALVVLGIQAWTAPSRRRWVAVGAFALAGLTRETILLVPAALLLVELVPPRGHRRDAVALGLTAVPYAAWVVVVRWRVGAWPVGSIDGRLAPLPFEGLVDAASSWRPSDLLAAIVVLVPAIAVLAQRSDPILTAIVIGHVALAAVLGAPVWADGADFGRVLLPLGVICLLEVAPRLVPRPADAPEAGDRPGARPAGGGRTTIAGR